MIKFGPLDQEAHHVVSRAVATGIQKPSVAGPSHGERLHCRLQIPDGRNVVSSGSDEVHSDRDYRLFRVGVIAASRHADNRGEEKRRHCSYLNHVQMMHRATRPVIGISGRIRKGESLALAQDRLIVR